MGDILRRAGRDWWKGHLDREAQMMSDTEAPATLETALDFLEEGFKSAPDDNYKMVVALWGLSWLFDQCGRKDRAQELEKYSHWVSDLHAGIVNPIFKPA